MNIPSSSSARKTKCFSRRKSHRKWRRMALSADTNEERWLMPWFIQFKHWAQTLVLITAFAPRQVRSLDGSRFTVAFLWSRTKYHLERPPFVIISSSYWALLFDSWQSSRKTAWMGILKQAFYMHTYFGRATPLWNKWHQTSN